MYYYKVKSYGKIEVEYHLVLWIFANLTCTVMFHRTRSLIHAVTCVLMRTCTGLLVLLKMYNLLTNFKNPVISQCPDLAKCEYI